MAIIYTYPVKTTPVDADLVLISDSADNNNTKQVTISSIKSLTAGVTSVAATLPLVASAATGDTTLSLSGLSALGTAGQVIKVNSGETALEFGTISGGDLPIEEEGSQITAAAAKINFTGTGATASASENNVTVNIPGGGPGTGTQYSIPFWSTASVLGDSMLSQNVGASLLSIPSGTLSITDGGTNLVPSIAIKDANTGIFSIQSGRISLGVSGTESLTIDATLGAILGPVTQFNNGLKFSNSGDALSDYDVGTWSPKIQNVAGTVDYDTGTGSYTIIGDVVHADFSIPITATVSSTYFRLSVPFTPAGSISAINLTGNADPNTGADSTGWVSGKTISTGYGIFLSYATTNGLAVSTSATITNGNTISGSMTYKK